MDDKFNERGVDEALIDLEQDIARSAFADMILDEDRNQRYCAALRAVIKEKHDNGEKANVVDIGTGSGLLSLAAAASGADVITAVEMFQPVAQIAEQIFRRSKFAEKICLVNSRSTEITHDYLSLKGNIIVAEVFDSELIGEGALRTFKQAHGTLVDAGSRVIPSSATVWALPVESVEIRKFNQHPGVLAHKKGGETTCMSLSAGFDLQMSELEPGVDFRPLCSPFVAFRFNFEDADSIHYNERVLREFFVDPDACIIVEKNGNSAKNLENHVNNFLNASECEELDETNRRGEFSAVKRDRANFDFDCVFLWWDLDMDGSNGKNCLTMAPTWINSSSAWRDHWMQMVYFLPNAPYKVRRGETIALNCFHDEFSFRFSIATNSELSVESSCTLHSVNARNAFYRMNHLEQSQRQVLDALMEFSAARDVICVGEGSLLGLYATTSARSVTIIEPDRFFQQILAKTIAAGFNGSRPDQVVRVIANVGELDCDRLFESSESIGVIGEPYFLSSILPSNNLHRYRSELAEIRKKFSTLSKIKHLRVDSFIKTIDLIAVPVKFENLWKTVANVDTALGFDLSPFNDLYQRAIRNADDSLGAFPLWEYPSVVTGYPRNVCRVQFEPLHNHSNDAASDSDFTKYASYEEEVLKSDLVEKANGTNAIVFYTEVEYSNSMVDLLENTTKTVRISNGLIHDGLNGIGIGDVPKWQRGHWQAVHFLSEESVDSS